MFVVKTLSRLRALRKATTLYKATVSHCILQTVDMKVQIGSSGSFTASY